MLNIFRQDKTGELVNILEIINGNIDKLQASKLALHKAVSMIAKAIAKSEILVQSADGEFRYNDDYYYRLNVQPNSNEVATTFWKKVVTRLLINQECLVIPVTNMRDGKENVQFYIAETWTENEYVLKPKYYSQITVSDGKHTLLLNRRYRADEVMHFKYENERVYKALNAVMSQYDRTIDSVNAMAKLATNPKFKFKIDAQSAIRLQAVKQTSDKEASKDPKKVLDAYAETLLNSLSEDKISLLTINDGFDLSQLKIETGVTVSAVSDAIKEANKITAMAFDIPLAVFEGTITEKSDATNEFITYACMDIVETMNDVLNAVIVGENDYKNGERIVVWMGNFSHKDLIDSANGLEKLRGVGFTFDECRMAVGFVPLRNEYSTSRALTKNFETVTDGERNDS